MWHSCAMFDMLKIAKDVILISISLFFFFNCDVTLQCTIHRNGNGLQSVQLTDLTVIEKLKFAPPPTSKGLEIGSVGKIHCKVQGTPTPHTWWSVKVSQTNITITI